MDQEAQAPELAQAAEPAKPRRGRPPMPGGNKRQRRRAELVAAGKTNQAGNGRGMARRGGNWSMRRAQPVLEALRRGLTLAEASRVAGTSDTVTSMWMVRKPEFLEAVTAARHAAAYNMPDQARAILAEAEARIETVDRRLASAVIMSARNRADLLMRCAAIYNRRMSERFYIHGDADGGPIKVEIRTFSVGPTRTHIDGKAEIVEVKPMPEGARPSLQSIESDS